MKAHVSSGLPADPAARETLRRALLKWFAESGRDLPWRRTCDPYAIMVSEFMLQQTQVLTVIPYYERWLARFPDFRALAAAPEADVLHAWQGLGYYARARNLHRAAKHVSEKHDGRLTDDPALIATLPGVGPYTAGAIASFAFDRVTPAVDANIARVLARLADFHDPIDTPSGNARIWEIAALLLPETGGRLYTSALMELGALVCVPRNPRCLECPVRSVCSAREPETLPVKKPRRKTVHLVEVCGWIVRNGNLLLERQTGSRWTGMWKLPALAAAPDAAPIAEEEYPFTHHRVTLKVFRSAVPGHLGEDHEWLPLSELDGVAMASGHRRAMTRLLAKLQTAAPSALPKKTAFPR